MCGTPMSAYGCRASHRADTTTTPMFILAARRITSPVVVVLPDPGGPVSTGVYPALTPLEMPSTAWRWAAESSMAGRFVDVQMEQHLLATFGCKPRGFADLATVHRHATLQLIREWCSAGERCSTSAALLGSPAADDVDRTSGFRSLVSELDASKDDPLAERFSGDLAIAFFLWLQPEVASFAGCLSFAGMEDDIVGVMYRGKRSGVHIKALHPLELWEKWCK